MDKLMTTLLTFWNDITAEKEKGATAVEYGLLVAAIAAVIVGVAFTLGGQVQTAFQTVSDAITNKGK